MTQGFYEQLGVAPDASKEEIRDAFARVVATLLRRRKALMEQGGDTSRLDLSEAQVNEAWEVLSSPIRRRRYDAMRALTQEGAPQSEAELWGAVSGALVDPGVAAAFSLVEGITDLRLGALPKAPGAVERRAPRRVPPVVPARGRQVEEEPTVTITERMERPAVRQAPPKRTPPSIEVPKPDLKVVEGRPTGSPVIVLPDPPKRARAARTLQPDEVRRLIDTHGYSGALLQAAREARSLEIQEMGETTRISVRYLEAIESEEWGVLPSSTFVRGYVREMARLLGLPEYDVVQGYMRRLEQA